MFKKCIIIAFGLILGFSVVASAQNSVKGTVVTSDTKEPIVGGSVFFKGTNVGTITNLDGTFSFNAVPAGAQELVVSYVGFKDQVVPVAAVVNVELEVDAEFLETAVVTAMGISREKKALGYAVQDVKSEDLMRGAPVSLGDALQGKLSGVEITPSSGMPGASSQIVIRGARSFDGNNTPLFVVDGLPVASAAEMGTGDSVTGPDYATRTLDIDPNDIESVNVLKGQAASGLYGMRASNGVIVITTKKGSANKKGRAKVTFTSNFSVETVSTLPDYQTEFAQGSGGAFSPNTSLAWGPKISDLADDANYGGNTLNDYTAAYGMHPGMYYSPKMAAAGLDGWTTPQAYNNIKDYFKTGYTTNNYVSVAKNFGNANLAASLGYTKTEGIVPSTGLDKFNARIAADGKLSKNFTLGFTANYIQSDLSKQTGANDGFLACIYGAPASYDLAGTPTHVPGDPYTQVNYRSLTFDNPYWAIENNKFTEENQRFFGNAYVAYNTGFGSSNHKLEVKYQIGMDAYHTNYTNNFGYGSKGKDGEIEEFGDTNSELNSLLTANYNWNISNDWNFNALLGNEVVYNRNKYLYTYGQHYNFSGWNHLNNVKSYVASESHSRFLSIGTFANIGVDWKNMLFLNATCRVDQVSSMPSGNRTFVYPTVAASWVFTELEGLKGNKGFSFGKLRASYAEVGQAGNYKESYYSIPQYGGGFSSGAPVSYPINNITAYTPYSVLYDPNLRPQNTQSYEVGLDLGFLEGRITASYTYSRQNVIDQIFEIPMAASTGYYAKMMNGGRIHTDAHELTLGFIPVLTRDFEWDLNFNFTKTDNYVDELAEGVNSIFLGGFTEPQVRAGIGDKFPVLYGVQYLRDDKGNIVVDENGLPMAGDEGVLGTVAPDFRLGFSTSFSWKKLTLSATFDWKQGGKMYYGTYAMMDYYGSSQKSADYRNMESFIFEQPAVKQDGTPNDILISGENAFDYFNVLSEISEYFIHDASYVKLREVSLSYPFQCTKNFSIRANVFARNLLLWSSVKGFDPEASQGNTNMAGGFERFSLPGSSSYGLGLTFEF